MPMEKSNNSSRDYEKLCQEEKYRRMQNEFLLLAQEGVSRLRNHNAVTPELLLSAFFQAVKLWPLLQQSIQECWRSNPVFNRHVLEGLVSQVFKTTDEEFGLIHALVFLHCLPVNELQSCTELDFSQINMEVLDELAHCVDGFIDRESERRIYLQSLLQKVPVAAHSARYGLMPIKHAHLDLDKETFSVSQSKVNTLSKA